jgi:hypothetical protein
MKLWQSWQARSKVRRGRKKSCCRLSVLSLRSHLEAEMSRSNASRCYLSLTRSEVSLCTGKSLSTLELLLARASTWYSSAWEHIQIISRAHFKANRKTRCSSILWSQSLQTPRYWRPTNRISYTSTTTPSI